VTRPAGRRSGQEAQLQDFFERAPAPPRYAGIATFGRQPFQLNPAGADVAVFGVPYDSATTFRTGARYAPAAIRQASGLLREYNPVLRVAPFDAVRVVDAGDVAVVSAYIEATYARVEAHAAAIGATGAFPLALGGDHSVVLPLLRAVARRHGPVSLVQFDSHPDTWDSQHGARHGHATPIRRAIEEGLIAPQHSIQVGLRGSTDSADDLPGAEALGLRSVTMAEARDLGVSGVLATIRSRVCGCTYITLDIDAVDPAFAPGTGTPEVGGFTSAEMVALVRGLVGLELVGMDIVEVCPPFDAGEITAVLAANLAYEVISLVALGIQNARQNR
jgi:agmatinase